MIYRDDQHAAELLLTALRADIAVLERTPSHELNRLRAAVRREARRLRRLRQARLMRVVPRSLIEVIVAVWLAFSIATVATGLVFTGAFVVALLHHA